MSFKDQVINFIKDVYSKLVDAFTKFAQEVFTSETKLVIAEFKDFAIAVVVKLAGTDLTSESKRAEAFKEIKEEAIKRGKNLSDSMINLLVEMSVQWVKNKGIVA